MADFKYDSDDLVNIRAASEDLKLNENRIFAATIIGMPFVVLLDAWKRKGDASIWKRVQPRACGVAFISAGVWYKPNNSVTISS